MIISMITSVLSQLPMREVYKETEMNERTFEMANTKQAAIGVRWTVEMEEWKLRNSLCVSGNNLTSGVASGYSCAYGPG